MQDTIKFSSTLQLQLEIQGNCTCHKIYRINAIKVALKRVSAQLKRLFIQSSRWENLSGSSFTLCQETIITHFTQRCVQRDPIYHILN